MKDMMIIDDPCDIVDDERRAYLRAYPAPDNVKIENRKARRRKAAKARRAMR